jgi:hypothetical protein
MILVDVTSGFLAGKERGKFKNMYHQVRHGIACETCGSLGTGSSEAFWGLEQMS